MISHARLRRLQGFAAVVALCAAGAVRAAGPEILTQVPSDAYGVVVIGNVRTFANKITSAAGTLHVADSLPPDLISSATRTIGITSGFDQNGSAALVLLKPAPGGDHPAADYFNSTPPFVLLVPSTNAIRMLERFSPTDPDKDGISTITSPDNPDQKGFAAIVDKKWAALALKREDLATYMARGASFASTASADTLKTFDANDLVVWGNVEKLGAGADKWLDDQQADLGGMRDLTNFVQGNDALESTLEKHSLGVFFDIGRQFFHDARGSMVTVRLTDSGATLGLIAEFKPDTPMGKFVAAQKGAGAVSFKGLPAGSFLFAGSGKWNGDAMAGAARSFMNQIIDDPALAKDARLGDLRKMTDALSQATQMTSGGRFTVLEPGARGKDGSFSGAFLIDVADPRKFVDLEMQLAKSPLAQQGMNADIKQTVTLTPNAVTVKDVPLTRMNVKLALREETADNPIPAASKAAFEAAQKVYGPEGMTVHMGAVGQRVLLIYGSNINVTDMEGMVTAAQGDSDAIAALPAIAATKDQLVANPVAVAYLPIARWVSLVPAMIGLGGDAGPAPGAGAAPPAVMSLGVSGTMVTAEIHVPLATITATQDAIRRLQGGGPGGPGGGGGGIVPNLP